MSSRDHMRAQTLETEIPAPFGLPLNDHAMSALSPGSWSEPSKGFSPEAFILNSAHLPPTFDCNQWVSSFELPSAPSSPAPDIFNKPPSVLVDLAQNHLITAHSTCQCHDQSANCVQNVHFAPTVDLLCTCCHLPFDWIHDPTLTNFEYTNPSS
jgi:hypothetical protein